MSSSAEKFNRWLKHAEQLDQELRTAPAEPAQRAPADGEAWTPSGPDPFGMNWKWISAATSAQQASTSSVPRDPQFAVVGNESPKARSSHRQHIRRIVLSNRSTFAMAAAALLLGLAIGGWLVPRRQADAGPQLAFTSLSTTLSPTAVRNVDGAEPQWDVGYRAPMDGFLCVVVVDADQRVTVLPGLSQDAMVTRAAAESTVTLPPGTQAGVLLITEQPVHFELYRAFQRVPPPANEPEKLGDRVVQELKSRNYRRASISLISPPKNG